MNTPSLEFLEIPIRTKKIENRVVFIGFTRPDDDLAEFMEWAEDQPCTISGSTLADVIASVIEEHLN